MFTNITWAQFGLTISLLTAIYYVIIFFLFFRKSVPSIFNNAFPGNFGKRLKITEEKDDDDITEGLNLFASVDQELLHDINDTLKQASVKNFSIEEIIFSLQIGLQKFNTTLLSGTKEKINEYIKKECRRLCSIHLDDDKLSQLWIK